MSYTPTEWANGDIITAEKLNKIEGGIAGSNGLIVNMSYNDELHIMTLDKTAREIKNAIENCANVIAIYDDSDSDSITYTQLMSCGIRDDGYGFQFWDFETFVAETLDDYPAINGDPLE